MRRSLLNHNSGQVTSTDAPRGAFVAFAGVRVWKISASQAAQVRNAKKGRQGKVPTDPVWKRRKCCEDAVDATNLLTLLGADGSGSHARVISDARSSVRSTFRLQDLWQIQDHPTNPLSNREEFAILVARYGEHRDSQQQYEHQRP